MSCGDFSAFVTCPAHQIRLHATPLRVADLLSRHEIRRRPDIFGLSATDAMTRCSHAASSAAPGFVRPGWITRRCRR